MSLLQEKIAPKVLQQLEHEFAVPVGAPPFRQFISSAYSSQPTLLGKTQPPLSSQDFPPMLFIAEVYFFIILKFK